MQIKNKIKNILKTNQLIYNIFSYSFSAIFSILKIFIRIDNNTILINSFGGKKYDDSPRVIFEYMKSQEKYKKYKIYWAFEHPEDFEIEGAEKVKSDTLQYFIIALKAKYWITNSAIERGLKFKNKKTIYINTWHGTPIKKIGKEANSGQKVIFKDSSCDLKFAQSEYEIEVCSKAGNTPKEKYVLVGLPRNDELFSTTKMEIDEIRKKLNIPDDKKVILYAPTFRDWTRDNKGCILRPPIDINKWKEKLSNEYIVLFRAHYEINKTLGIKDDEFMRNMTDYPNLNELLKISDILISDYSSIVFDYSILKRPIFAYCYDYEEYKEKRGFYIDINEEFPNGICKTEDELLKQILDCDFELQKEKTTKFQKKYVQNDGNARKYIDKIIS